MMAKHKERICSICQDYYEEFGNNAQPVNDGACCDRCNWTVVIPARLNQVYNQKIKQKESD